jgi:hypothetical protein
MSGWTDTGLSVVENPSAAQGYYTVDVTPRVLADLQNDPGRAAVDGATNHVMSHFLIRWDKEGATNAFLTFDAEEGTVGDPSLELTIGTPPAQVTIQTYNSWAEKIGGLAGYAPGQSGPTNHWPLISEYALGTDPTTPTLGLVPATTAANFQQLGTYSLQNLVVSNTPNLYLTLNFDFNREADDIEIAVRESSNFLNFADSLVLQPPYDGSSPARSLTGPGSLAAHPNVVSVQDNPTNISSPSLTAHITARSSIPVPARPSGYMTIAVRSTVVSATAPTNLRATDHFGILLEWEGTAEKGGFAIERSPAGAATFTPVGRSEVAQFTDTTAVVGQAFDYRVRAVNAAGVSAWSNLATARRSA